MLLCSINWLVSEISAIDKPFIRGYFSASRRRIRPILKKKNGQKRESFTYFFVWAPAVEATFYNKFKTAINVSEQRVYRGGFPTDLQPKCLFLFSYFFMNNGMHPCITCIVNWDISF